jgi:hypothetical protein
MLLLALVFSARIAIDDAGRQVWTTDPEELAQLLLEGEGGARRAVSIIQRRKVDVDGYVGLAIQEGQQLPTPLVLATMQIYMAQDRPAELLSVLKALLDAGANPNVIAGWESVLGTAISGLGSGADELWEVLLPYRPNAGISKECHNDHDSVRVEARSSCLPLLKLWASVVDERMNWVKTMSKADAVLHQGAFDEWVDNEARVFAAMKWSPTFAEWFAAVKHTAQTGTSTTDFRRLPYTMLEKIVGEIFGHALGQLSELPGFSWEQAAGGEAWSTPKHLYSALHHSGGLLHLLAYDGAVTSLEALVNLVVKLPAAAATILECMRIPDSRGRTPLHYLAFSYGMTEHFNAWMVQVERLAVAAKVPWESGEVFLAGLPPDSYQHPPLYYLNRSPITAAPEPSNADRTGDWPRSTYGASLETTPPGRCGVDTAIRDANGNATQALFEEHLYSRWPILIRNECSKHLLRKKWKRNQFLEKYGSQEVTVGRIPYGGIYGLEMRAMPLSQYMRVIDDVSMAPGRYGSAAPYLFNSKDYLPWLDNDIKPSPTVLRRLSFGDQPPEIVQQQFYLGPPESGAPVHLHNDAVNYLFYGRKRWFLYPPGAAEWSIQPAADFLEKTRVEQRAPIECVQHSGDMLYVPKGWGHSTINIEASIGVAYEFGHNAGTMEPLLEAFAFA